jgi:hypothetical protein
MTALEVASKSLNLEEKWFSEFDVEDTFNNGMRLCGAMCRKPDYRYGSLVITEIDNQEALQIIYGTPKLHYPFDKNGVFKWPPIKYIQGYVKEDGTNIVAYWYKFKGRKYLSYKTRLTPVLRDAKFGSFYSMWMEYFDANSWVIETILGNPNYNLSFEMFGSRNPITIQYDIPLDVRLLFGIDRSTATIVPPSVLNGLRAKVPKKYVGGNYEELTVLYQQMQNELSLENKERLVIEGLVLYAYTSEYKWEMFKLKPSEIEHIHWTASDTIPKNSIWTTAINCYEGNNAPTIEDLLELLREEYEEHLLTKNTKRIEKIWKEAELHMEFVAIVNSIWSKALVEGFDITKNKNATMRYISQFFDKNEMRKVGSIILKQAGLL